MTLRTVTFDETKWKLVPIEPTADMLYEVQENAHLLPPRAKRVYAMLLAAAPEHKEE